MGYRVESALPREVYLSTLKSKFRFPNPFEEQVSGIMIGPFFSVAYWSAWEWNRRITHECNRAMGFVREVDGKTEVHFIRSKGLVCVSWLLGLFLLLTGAVLAVCVAVTDLDAWTYLGPCMVFGAVVSLMICGLSALCSSVTEEGEQGKRVVTNLLTSPDEFYYY